MKISYNWLKDYLNINLPPQEVADILTQIGLEVSKVEKYESVKGGLEGLIIGKVLTCEKHPKADKLSITTVDIGGKILPIVCGAPNVDKGQKVVVATVGTKLYNGDEVWEIKKAKIRGEVSEGMICAEDEIGLGDDHEGIMVLDEDAPVGKPAKDYFKIYSDTVFEIDITPNRPDAISHFGVARDLYAYLKIHTDLDLELKLPQISDFKTDDNTLEIDIEVKNTEACPRYTGLSLTNIKIDKSPEWIQNRLKAIGLKPINNVVDITNYVLHEIGHPLHAFDAKKITGNKVIVSTVAKGTKFVTLEEKEIELTDKDLMICDANLKPMCIGGVMGGLETAVNNNTTSVFLESAFFNPVWVRKTAKRHGISTDASYRFERGVDPNNCLWTLKRCALLIKEYAGAKISSQIKDIYPEKIEKFRTKLTFRQLDKIVGFKIDRKKVKKILTLLEIDILNENVEGYELAVPTYRFEVRRQADIIEEIIRIYGYNEIPTYDSLHTTILLQDKDQYLTLKNKVSHLLAARGFYEIMSFSLLSGELLQQTEAYENERLIKMHNALSKELDTMRISLLFGALDAVRRNINHGNPNLKLFEFGSTYNKTSKTNFDEKYIEQTRLGITVTGKKNPVSWTDNQKDSNFYTLKGYTQMTLKALGFDLRNMKVSEFSDKLFKYGLRFEYNSKTIVEFGAISRKIRKIYDIDQDVFFAEFYWDTIIKNIPNQTYLNNLTKFPTVSRDLALLLDKNISYKEVEKIVWDTDKRLIKKVTIFDVYEGKNVAEGKKSYAINILLQDENKTLTDKVVNKIMNKLIYNFKQKLGAEIRQ